MHGYMFAIVNRRTADFFRHKNIAHDELNRGLLSFCLSRFISYFNESNMPAYLLYKPSYLV